MQVFDPNNPNEKKKMIAGAVLGVGAIAVLGYVFFGGSSTKTTTTNTIAKASPTPTKSVKDETQNDDPSVFQPVNYVGTQPAVSEADRNIFAYYVPPSPPVKAPYVPTPTPMPPPPLTASSLMPSSIFARTPADFSLQVMRDNFTPAIHNTIDVRYL